MKNVILLATFLTLLFIGCDPSKQRFTDYVDPFIGTGGHGHTFPGATLPFGMVQLSPDTRKTGWDGCAGYHYTDTVVYGFSHTHLSGTGVSDYADILLMPTTGEYQKIFTQTPTLDYSSGFCKSTEKARPGYYSVYLNKSKCKVELSATCRAGMHRYTFVDTQQFGLIVDLHYRDEVLASSLIRINDSTFIGHRHSKQWAENQHLYFAIRTNQPVKEVIVEGDILKSNDTLHHGSEGVKTWFKFNNNPKNQLLVKVGISAVDTDGALNNLDKEIPHWDFNKVKNDADTQWEEALRKIEVEGGSKEERTIFYTALYHTMIAPNIYSDYDRRYRGRDMKIYRAEDFDYYTVFSLWDTYRATHPLLTIIEPERTNDFIKTFLCQYQQGGRLPVWELASNETECMIGYHAVSVINDAWQKGIRSYDEKLALEAMTQAAYHDAFGGKEYRTHGYIPADQENESVSRTLEYAYDDWCIAQMAKGLGEQDIYKEFIVRSQYYKNIFDPVTGFFRPKSNGAFIEPFNPAEVNFHLTEANTWQYNFYVPHDVSGLINLFGNTEAFIDKLDLLFSDSSALTGRQQPDITGLIGQYAHGNEPSHHIAYLFACAGQPWKTQAYVRQIMNDFYTTKPDGLIGNEDCGQMSAWYVLSAAGFYPVCPGSNNYVIGSPIFDKVTFHLNDEKKFIVQTCENSKKHKFISEASFNDNPYHNSYITHDMVSSGGILKFTMSKKANEFFGRNIAHRPVYFINDYLITPVPYISSGENPFFDSITFHIKSKKEGTLIHWHGHGGNIVGNPLEKSGGVVYDDILIEMFATQPEHLPSKTVQVAFTKIPERKQIDLLTNFSSQYSAGGNNALVDFKRGNTNYKTGRWQGYEGEDLVAIITLENIRKIKSLSAGFLQDQQSWIFMPLEVSFYTSVDGKRFTLAGTVKNNIPPDKDIPVTKNFRINRLHINAKYIKVKAKNRRTCPEWHIGRGKKAWLFADEITVE